MQESSVVFNNIDVGEYYDAAVMSLCMHCEKLLICGGNFAQQFCVDSVKPGQNCLQCANGLSNTEVLEKILPSKIASVESLEWIPRDTNPIAQSNFYLCAMTCNMLVSRFATLLIDDPEVKVNQRFIMTVNSEQAFGYDIERDPNCAFCNDIQKQL